MASINDIITITVINSAKSVSQVGFGTLLFITDSVPVTFTDVIRIYTNTDAILGDGFIATDKAYLAAQCYFSQTPTPQKLMIAPRTHKDSTTLDDWPTTIEKISNINSDWYAIATYSKDDTEIIAISNYIESQKKIYTISSSEASIRDTNFDPNALTPDVFSQLKKLDLSRTAPLFSTSSDKFPECGWFGSGLAANPGTTTYCYKNIATIPVDSLSETQSQNIFNKSANTFEYLAGQNITRYGSVPSGNYIDIIMGIDYISARIQENIYSALVNNPKIPYTDAGITIIHNQINGILNTAMEMDIISEYSVQVPKSSAIDPNVKSTRVLGDIYINLTMSGAIQKVKVQIVYKA